MIANMLGLGKIVETVGAIASDLVTTDRERWELALEERRIDQATDLAQMEVNKVEAGHASLFVAGWRPAIGWIGAAALAYQFLLYPLMLWGMTMAQGYGLFPGWVEAPPLLPTDALWVILSGMLGIAGMRSLDKIKGVDTRATR